MLEHSRSPWSFRSFLVSLFSVLHASSWLLQMVRTIRPAAGFAAQRSSTEQRTCCKDLILCFLYAHCQRTCGKHKKSPIHSVTPSQGDGASFVVSRVVALPEREAVEAVLDVISEPPPDSHGDPLAERGRGLENGPRMIGSRNMVTIIMKNQTSMAASITDRTRKTRPARASTPTSQ